MRTAVLYGAHGTFEPFSVALGESLWQQPIDNIVPIVENPAAIAQDVRMVDENMTVAYANASATAPSNERRCAAGVIQLCERYDPDMVVGIHTTRAPAANAAYVRYNASPQAVRVATLLGFEHIIFTDFDSVGMAFPDTILTEINEHPQNPMHNIRHWRRVLRELGELDPEDYEPSQRAKLWLHVGTLMVEDLPVSPRKARDFIRSRTCYSSYQAPQSLLVDDTEEFNLPDSRLVARRNTFVYTWSDQYLEFGGVAELVRPAPQQYDQFYYGGVLRRPTFAGTGPRTNGFSESLRVLEPIGER